MRLRPPRRFLLATLVVALGIPGIGAAQPGTVYQETLRVEASFLHGVTPVGPAYTSAVRGSLDVTFAESTSSGTLSLPIGLGQRACGLSSTWLTTSPSSRGPATGSLQTCLAHDTASSETLNAWIDGTGTMDQTLSVAMTRTGSFQFVNAGPVAANVFVRDCSDSAHPTQRRRPLLGRLLSSIVELPEILGRTLSDFEEGESDQRLYFRYGTLHIAAGALHVVAFPGSVVLSVDTAAGETTIDEIDSVLWGKITKDCGNAHVSLPAAPSGGTAQSFTWSQPPLARDGDTLALRGTVHRATENGLVIRSNAIQLVDKLDVADEFLVRAEPRRAVETIEEFRSILGQMVARGEVPPPVALALENEVTVFRGITLGRITPPSEKPEDDQELIACPPRPSFCAPLVLHVDAVAGRRGLAIAPDGSEVAPYATIGEALAEAERRDPLCGVAIVVHPGTYREDVFILRDTRILAPDPGTILTGRIENRTGAKLDVVGLLINRAGAPGAIVVDNPCAVTNVVDVSIQYAVEYGIWQEGGLLNVSTSRVVFTQPGDVLVSQGTGIYLTGGVRADLVGVNIAANASGGLIVQGAGTDVTAGDLDVTFNHINPLFDFDPDGVCAFFEGAGGIVARFGAHLSVSDFWVTDNTLYSLLALSEGTEVSFEYGSVRTTYQTADADDSGCGGNNIAAFDDAHIELFDFRSHRAELCGLQLARGGTIDASLGYVFHNELGANVQTEGFDLSRIQDGVAWYNNVSGNLDTSVLPLPEPTEI